jgi:hypothetical protein
VKRDVLEMEYGIRIQSTEYRYGVQELIVGLVRLGHHKLACCRLGKWVSKFFPSKDLVNSPKTFLVIPDEG